MALGLGELVERRSFLARRHAFLLEQDDWALLEPLPDDLDASDRAAARYVYVLHLAILTLAYRATGNKRERQLIARDVEKCVRGDMSGIEARFPEWSVHGWDRDARGRLGVTLYADGGRRVIFDEPPSIAA